MVLLLPATIELARDKFLECCYTGLRISDANYAAWQHVHGQLLVLDNTANCSCPSATGPMSF